MSILISLIIWLVVLGLVWYLIGLLPLPAPVGTIITVIFILILILIVLGLFGIVPGFHLPTLNLRG
jgi:hypothetical protein